MIKTNVLSKLKDFSNELVRYCKHLIFKLHSNHSSVINAGKQSALIFRWTVCVFGICI